MQYVKLFFLFSLILVFAQSGFSQNASVDVLKDALAPAESDIQAAKQEGAGVFRLLPRGARSDIPVRGGGAYYSFFTRDHSYDKTPQIELQRDGLSVAFYGANYGFITDLGQVPLMNIKSGTPAISFLVNHKPVTAIEDARAQFRKAGEGFQADGTAYRQFVTVVEGDTYALRAISFDEADTLVAFKVYRKNADGSVVIFWKLLQNFDKPVLAREK